MKKNIAIFGDISTNGIDGSSIWLQSITSIFPKDKFNIFLILRDKIEDTTLLDSLMDVQVIDIFNTKYLNKDNENSCSTYELKDVLTNLNDEYELDHIIIRAPRYVSAFADKVQNECFKKLLSKMDVYFASINIMDRDYDRITIEKVGKYINRLILQTEQMRDYVEKVYPQYEGRVIVLSPMIPNFLKKEKSELLIKLESKNLIYAGKLDSEYNVENMLELALEENQEKFTITYIGAKVNRDKSDKMFATRIVNKLEANEYVTWFKKLDREATIKKIEEATFIMSFRKEKYDTSNEISTKLLEALSVGTLPVLKRTASNVNMLGEEYPFYISDINEIPNLIQKVDEDKELYCEYVFRLQEKVQQYTFGETYKRIHSYYEKENLSSIYKFSNELNVLIASHDNKFFQEVIKELQIIQNINLKFDNWSTTVKHDEKQSKELLEWADVIFCEWAVGAALFYSQYKKENQKLLIRLHRFEITTNIPEQINHDNVDQFIVVSDYLKSHCIKNYGWPEYKIKVLGQYANTKLFDREKRSEQVKFNLGLLGAIPKLKRLDRALDILENLRKVDPRYILYIKSKMPWEVPFIWSKEEERHFYQQLLKRIATSDYLKNGVVFDEYGSDVPSWFRKIGWMLSTSEIEGCHTAVAEGMSSGAKPIVFDWPGASGVYKNIEIFSEPESASQYILKNMDFTIEEIERLKAYAKDNFDTSKTLEFYFNFLV